MAKAKGTAAAIGLVALIGLGAYLFASEAKAADDDDDDFDPTPDPSKPEQPGKGPGGVPKPKGGGKTFGDPDPDVGYLVPFDWDPVRGLYISPDCEMVVEAPGWYCGAGGPDLQTPQLYGGFACTAIEFESYVDTMAEPGNGVAGYVDFLLGVGMQPEEIAFQILTEVSPLCADLPDNMWPEGLAAWYSGFLDRVVMSWEEFHGLEFDPGAAA